MPHVPARGVLSEAELDHRLAAYADVGVREALVLAGGIARPHGPFSEALHLLRTGRFDARGFTRLHVAGHPEGNRDIDPDGGDTLAMAALARQGRLRPRDRRRDGRRHPVRLRGRAGHRLGRPPRARPASTCRCTSASPAPPSCRRCSSTPCPAASAPRCACCSAAPPTLPSSCSPSPPTRSSPTSPPTRRRTPTAPSPASTSSRSAASSATTDYAGSLAARPRRARA